MTAINTDWRSGWTASQPAYVGYAWAPNSGGDYRAADDGLLHRDLGLDAASDGRIGCERVRLASGQQVGDWRRLDVDFDFLYVLRGTIEIETADGQHVVLGTGGCAVQPGHTAYRYTHATSDLDAVHVTSPARYELLRGEAALAASVMPERPGVFTHDSDDQYKRGDGPRAFFLYRDLGTRAVTEGRIHFHVVRATEPGLGTGWHYHTMSQWFMVIGGSANISVEDHPKQPLGWGDAMCVGSGEHMRHNVTDFSSDYLVLEMCVPADYATIATDRPEGGAQTPI
jgi:quercetin dioxygenase-like cupin family protein